jgi:hypothetical protein
MPASEMGLAVFLANPYERRHLTDAHGDLELNGLPIGDPIELLVATNDGRTAKGTVTLPTAGAYEATFELDKTAALALRPMGRDGKLAPVLVCLDEQPQSVIDCYKSPYTAPVLWTDLPPGDHTAHIFASEALPWAKATKRTSRKIKLTGGEVTDLGDVLVPPGTGSVNGLVLEEAPSGVRVALVLEGETGARGGLRKGDVLLSVDGVPAKGALKTYDLLRGDEGTVAELRLRRGSEELTLRIVRQLR